MVEHGDLPFRRRDPDLRHDDRGPGLEPALPATVDERSRSREATRTGPACLAFEGSGQVRSGDRSRAQRGVGHGDALSEAHMPQAVRHGPRNGREAQPAALHVLVAMQRRAVDHHSGPPAGGPRPDGRVGHGDDLRTGRRHGQLPEPGRTEVAQDEGLRGRPQHAGAQEEVALPLVGALPHVLVAEDVPPEPVPVPSADETLDVRPPAPGADGPGRGEHCRGRQERAGVDLVSHPPSIGGRRRPAGRRPQAAPGDLGRSDLERSRGRGSRRAVEHQKHAVGRLDTPCRTQGSGAPRAWTTSGEVPDHSPRTWPTCAATSADRASPSPASSSSHIVSCSAAVASSVPAATNAGSP